jgi:catechol 2,3-dioxygenase-like lactoylglutathione lyase family enzyme
MKSIADIIGPTLPDHYALRVQPGRMTAAVAFFTELLGFWVEVKEDGVKADWGEARFVEPTLSMDRLRVQLSEPKGECPIFVDENHHIALSVKNPKLAAESIVEYFDQQGLRPSSAEELSGGKWWVTIPDIFVTPIEFVPI